MAVPRSPAPLAADAPRADAESRVVVHAPVGRDGALACDLLGKAGHACEPVLTVGALREALAVPPAVLVLTEEAMRPPVVDAIGAAIAAQAAWSDLPIVLFVSPGHAPEEMLRYLGAFGAAANVTLLERPVRPPTLRSVVDASVRARRRQYEVRDLLAELTGLNASLEAQVQERTAQVRALAASLTLAEQHERERISQVLHDDLQQLLFGLRLSLDAFGRAAEPDRPALAARNAEILDEAIRTTRTLAIELQPPSLAGEGLAETLEWAARHMEDRYGLHVDLDVEGGPDGVEGDLLVLLTRSVRELLFNVVKHADADHARLVVQFEPDVLRLAVEDNGVGTDEREGQSGLGAGLGLEVMRRRLHLLGGHLRVERRASGGTRAAITVPRLPA